MIKKALWEDEAIVQRSKGIKKLSTKITNIVIQTYIVVFVYIASDNT